MLERQLAEKRAELAEAQKKVEQKEIDLGMKLLDLEQQAAQARADLGRAQLKVDVPAEVQQRIELEKALLDKKGRERDIQNLEAEGRVTRALTGAELSSLRQQRDRAAGRVRALEDGIEKMNIKAPQDGIVVYRANWRDEKKKVGDSVWFGEVVLALPDLAEMKGDGFVDEADGGPVREGQPVTLRLEARSDFDLPGKVARIGRTVKQRSWRTPLKGYRVEIALAKTDPTFMRPAMRFRGEIETGRIPGVLLVPRDAVFLRDDGPVVWARRALGWREVKVTLGRSNRTQVEIVSGLAEGDRVSPVDLARARGRGAGRPGGSGRMRARLRRALGGRRGVLLAAGLLLLLVLLGARLVGSLETDAVATFEVRPGRFVREVEARGSLKAVKATPVLVPPESGRAQKVAFLAKDGATLKKGDTVAEFDPYDAQREAADGQADLTAARAKIDKARAEGSKNEKSLGLDRDVAKEELDRAETYKLTDEGLFSRHQIIESQLDRDLFAARADVAGRKLDASGKLSSAERALGEIDAGKARLKVEIAEKGLRSLRIAAPHDGLLVLERNWRGEVAVRGRHRSGRGRRSPSCPTSRSSRPRCSCSRPTGRASRPGSRPGSRSRAGPGRSTRPR